MPNQTAKAKNRFKTIEDLKQAFYDNVSPADMAQITIQARELAKIGVGRDAIAAREWISKNAWGLPRQVIDINTGPEFIASPEEQQAMLPEGAVPSAPQLPAPEVAAPAQAAQEAIIPVVPTPEVKC